MTKYYLQVSEDSFRNDPVMVISSEQPFSGLEVGDELLLEGTTLEYEEGYGYFIEKKLHHISASPDDQHQLWLHSLRLCVVKRPT